MKVCYFVYINFNQTHIDEEQFVEFSYDYEKESFVSITG